MNRWIRDVRRFDAVLDFEKAVQDPQNPLSIRKDLTTDYVHPNTEGYRLMGESVSLKLFELAGPGDKRDWIKAGISAKKTDHAAWLEH